MLPQTESGNCNKTALMESLGSDLMRMDTNCSLSAVFPKKFFLKGKNLHPGSKFDPFRVDPVFKGGNNVFVRLAPLHWYPFPSCRRTCLIVVVLPVEDT